MSDPRGFVCPATDSPCTNPDCNYKATGYCSQEKLEFRRDMERKRLQEVDRLAEG